jgi:hypothetical protein
MTLKYRIIKGNTDSTHSPRLVNTATTTCDLTGSWLVGTTYLHQYARREKKQHSGGKNLINITDDIYSTAKQLTVT